MISHLDYEEDFHHKDTKTSRKERKILTQKDRSKYKKTDQKKNKETQTHEHLLRGRVLKITGEGILVLIETEIFTCSLRGVLKKEKTKNKNLIAVGDFVFLKESSKNQGQIHAIEPRKSELLRTDLSGKKKQVLASNIDQVFITASVVTPPFKPFLIDRYIIAAKKGNMLPIVLINKIDLLPSATQERLLVEEFIQAYEEMGITILKISCKAKKNMTKLKKQMLGKASVFSGQSGTGKSSILNEVLKIQLAVKETSTKSKKGQHTTSTASLIPLINGGFCIDTPGIKSFGLWDVTKEDLLNHFIPIKKMGKKCKFPNCDHVHEPKCAVKKAVEEEMIPPLIYESYLTLLEDLYE